MRKFLNRLAVNAMCGAFAAKEKVCQAVEDLKRDERGLSGIVVAVLLILVAFMLAMGRYRGYRLTELFRFKALLKD